MIVLASNSPRRRELMKLITEDFISLSSPFEEKSSDKNPFDIPLQNALGKARSVSEKRRSDIIIGADTAVFLGRRMFGKPRSKEEIKEYISLLSGRTHKVITGVAIIKGDKEAAFSCTAKVKFRSLSEDEISAYADTGEGLDKAGGYGIQGKGALLIESIKGDYYNVVGLPVSALNKALCEFEQNFKTEKEE